MINTHRLGNLISRGHGDGAHVSLLHNILSELGVGSEQVSDGEHFENH